MSERVFDYDTAFAAMCIMEEIADSAMPDAPQPWQDFRDQNGVMALRDVVLTKLAMECNDAWERAYSRYEEAVAAAPTLEDGRQILDPGDFDYIFVPTWLRLNVDWSDFINGPRVLGTTMSEQGA